MGIVAKTDSLVYNVSNQLVSKTTVNSSNETDTYTYSYDNKGNCIGYTKDTTSAIPETVTYQYDGFNFLVGQTTNGIQDYIYDYDILGHRIRKTVFFDNISETTNHYWFGNTIVFDENTTTNVTNSYVFGNGIVGFIRGNQKYIYETNAKGDVTSILGTTESNAYTYDAYGNVVEASNTTLINDNPYRYGSYY